MTLSFRLSLFGLAAVVAACATTPSADTGPDYVVDKNTKPPEPAASPPPAPPSEPVLPPMPADPGGGSPDAGTKPNPTFCTSQTAVFCEDFDSAPLPATFTGTSGSYLTATSVEVVSKPNALHVDVPAAATGGFGSRLSRDFTNPMSKSAAVAFDFFPETISTGNAGFLFAALEFVKNAAAKYSIRLAYVGGRVRLEESNLTGTGDIYHPLFDLPHAWSRVSFAVTFTNNTPSSAQVSVDGATVGNAFRLVPPANVDYHPTLLVGAVYGQDRANGWKLGYDNVVLDYQ